MKLALKITRELLAMPIMWVGIIFLILSCFIGGKEYGSELIETFRKN